MPCQLENKQTLQACLKNCKFKYPWICALNKGGESKVDDLGKI